MMWIECLSSASYSGLNGKLEIGRGRGGKKRDNRLWKSTSATYRKSVLKYPLSERWRNENTQPKCNIQNIHWNMIAVSEQALEHFVPFAKYANRYSKCSKHLLWMSFNIPHSVRMFSVLSIQLALVDRCLNLNRNHRRQSNIFEQYTFWHFILILFSRFFPSSFLFWYI